MQRRTLLFTSIVPWVTVLAPSFAGAKDTSRSDGKPALWLANTYSAATPLSDHWVSEKYDGVRGFWSGERLLTRGGETIHAPDWFTEGWPRHPMEGELWAGRGQFAHAVSTVRQQTPDDNAWHRIRFMVFDLPAHGGPFTDRIAAYQRQVQALGQIWVEAVHQRRLPDRAALQALLDKTVKAGGEGLVLHRAAALYRSGRSDDVLKAKPHDDAEGVVLAHVPGQGKHVGRMGALWVRTPDGVRFKLGTGFTDEQRAHPPEVGAQVTYRYRGLTAGGVPRFASFLRERVD